MAGLFIAGTDTGVGKTFVAEMLLRGLQARGMTVAGMKPVASGCGLVNGELRNDDALTLLSASGTELSYNEINPYPLEAYASPNIAASLSGTYVDLEIIKERYFALSSRFDFVVVEGVGGWATPLNEQETAADMASSLGLPVLVVVGLRLGCLNHAILTEQAVIQSRADLVGWVANEVDDSLAFVKEIHSSLTARLISPGCGFISHRRLISGDLAGDASRRAGDKSLDQLLRRLAPIS